MQNIVREALELNPPLARMKSPPNYNRVHVPCNGDPLRRLFIQKRPGSWCLRLQKCVAKVMTNISPMIQIQASKIDDLEEMLRGTSTDKRIAFGGITLDIEGPTVSIQFVDQPSNVSQSTNFLLASIICDWKYQAGIPRSQFSCA